MEDEFELQDSVVQEALEEVHLEEVRVVLGPHWYTLVVFPGPANPESSLRIAPGLTPIENPGGVT